MDLKSDAFYRSILADIVNGYSKIKGESDSDDIFVKHESISDNVARDEFYEFYLNRFVQKKIPTDSQIEEMIFTKKLWLKSEEKRMQWLEEEIENLEKTISLYQNENDKNILQKDVDNYQEELIKLKNKKESFFKRTAEKMAQQKTDELYIIKCLYKDSNFKEKYLSEDEYEDEETDLVKLFKAYYDVAYKMSMQNIKILATKDFFQDIFSLAENVYQFYDIKISALTYYQSHLAHYGKIFKTIFKDPRIKNTNDPDQIIKNYQAIINKDNKSQQKNESGGLGNSSQTINKNAMFNKMRQTGKSFKEITGIN